MSTEFRFGLRNPITCPNGCTPVRIKEGMSTTTLAYYPPIYDETGRNINPDRNRHNTSFMCLVCGQTFGISSQYGEEDKLTIGPKKDPIIIDGREIYI